MANAKPSRPGKRQNDAPTLTPNPIVGEAKEVERHGVKMQMQELANGDKIYTRTDLDPRFDRGRRGRSN